MAQKYYAIFDVCIDSYQKDSLKIKKTSLFANYLQEMKKEDPDPWFIKAKTVYESRTCGIQCDLLNLRRLDAYDDKYRRCHRFKTKYFIHEVDKLGWLKLSKKEQADAEAELRRREERKNASN